MKTILNIIIALSILLGNITILHAEDLHANHNMKEIWTCSMHPQIKMEESGKCPICGMDLIPVSSDETPSSSNGKVTLTLGATAEKLANIQTTKVIRKSLDKEIRLVGTIDYDETKLTHITAWVPGRIDRMFVDYTGISVKKDDHMLELYSPELLSAQEELIQANRSIKKLKNSSSSLVIKSTERALKSAEEKLLLLGLTKNQVKEIKNSSTPKDNVTIFAPVGGVVVERNATEGMYVQEGTRIYSIADLRSLWIYLDAYESDLPWIRYGQKVKFTTQALPGTTFEGTVSFISPIVNSETRTTRVRVNVDNSNGILKPGLFVKGIIHANVYSDEKVINTALKGKYIGPMHPEIISDEAGQCPICEMDLVPAEDLGYITKEVVTELPTVIPESAPLVTGKRAIVYVKDPRKSTYEAREVVLGSHADGYYVVTEGLKENELVVTNGAFKIDADLQIRGKKSMMNPDAVKQTGGHNHGDMTDQEMNQMESKKESGSKDLTNLLDTYLNLSEELASDDLELAKKTLLHIEHQANSLKNSELILIFKQNKERTDLESVRNIFGDISEILITKFKDLTLSNEVSAFQAHCPMALNGKGASWLQRGDKVRNPYFGKSMLSCGSIEGGM